MKKLLLAFPLLFLLLGSCAQSFQKSAAVSDGFVDLSSENLAMGPVTLRGSWAFFWKDDSDPSKTAYSAGQLAAATHLPVPGLWNDLAVDGKKVGEDGYGTYVAIVRLSGRPETLALSLINAASEYKIWVNGTLIGEQGLVGTDKKSSQGSAKPALYTFNSLPGDNTFVVKISNYTHVKGGLWENISLGLPETLKTRQLNRMFLELAIIACLAFMIFYNLVLFYFRRNFFAYLFFAISILFALLAQLVRGEHLVYYFWAQVPWDWLKKWQFSAYFFAAGFFGMMVYELFPEKVKKVFVLAFLAFSSLVGLLIMILPYKIGYYFAFSFFPAALLLFVYLFVLMANLALKKTPGSCATGFALLAITGAMIHDLLYTFDVIKDDYWLPYGVFIFLLSYTIALSRSFTLSFVRSEQMSIDLNRQNLMLANQIELDKKLEEENKKLYDDVRTTLQSQINLTDAYSRFVPEDYLNFLGKESILELQLGDQVQENMSIMFTDIRGFTSLSEGMTPKENFAFINDYLKRSIPVVKEFNGFVDKFLGDGYLALFPYRPDDALLCAIGIQKKVTHYNLEQTSGSHPPLFVGIGIHTGSLMLGTIGDERRMETTVISDDVNLASRIEGLTRIYDAGILISSDTFGNLEDPTQYNYRFLDLVKVKGKNKVVSIFEILDGIDEREFDVKLKMKDQFENGVILFQQQQFKEAYNVFRDILNYSKKDRAAMLYLSRCINLVKYGVPPDWDGVIVYDEK